MVSLRPARPGQPFMRTSVTILTALAALSPLADAQQKRIYIAPDDHTDYWWSGTETQYTQAFLGTIDYYLNQVDQTSGNPPDFQGRWNCDGSFWMWTYQKNRSASGIPTAH